MWVWMLGCGPTDAPAPAEPVVHEVRSREEGRARRRARLPGPPADCPVRPLAEWCNGESADRAPCSPLTAELPASFYTTPCGEYEVVDWRGDWGGGFVHVLGRARTHVATGFASDMCQCGCVTWYGQALPEVFDCLPR